jgi:exodeoxyribonuclease VII small subunit
MSFEQDVSRLEEIVRELERDDLDLDRALTLFEEGIGKLRTASTALAAADGRVQQLVEAAEGAVAAVDADGGAAEADA